MTVLKIDDDGNISTSSTPRSMKARILRDIWIEQGIPAITGDVWLMSRADALDLIAVDSAERVIEPGEIEITTSGLTIVAKGENDPKPQLLSRIPDRERKPRVPIGVPLNAHLGFDLIQWGR